ncbi:MAG: phosphodiester glycosidase family protein [Usitatibacter sp.]
MRRLHPALAFAAAALCGCAGFTEAPPVRDGLELSRMESVTPAVPLAIYVLSIDLTRPGTELEVTAGDPSGGRGFRAQTTSEFLVRNRMSAAVNASFFDPFKGGTPGGDDYYPRSGDPVDVLGLSMHAGRVDSPPNNDPKINGAVCIRKPAAVTIVRGQACPPGTDEALASGPVLLAGGEPQTHTLSMTARHPRTAFGLSADHRTAWMVVVDGRQLMSPGATLPEMAEILRRLGASEALNFDGGGSTALVIADGEAPRVVNVPIHTGVPGRERPSANHLGVRTRRGAP